MNVSASGFEPRVIEIPVSHADDCEHVRVMLRRAFDVEIRVISSDARAVPGALVGVKLDEQGGGSTRAIERVAASNGVARIQGLGAGLYLVECASADARARVRVPGVSVVTLKSSRSVEEIAPTVSEYRFEVVDDRGGPVPSATVAVGRGAQSLVTVSTDEGGRCVVRAPWVGDSGSAAWVRAMHPDFRPELRLLNVTDVPGVQTRHHGATTLRLSAPKELVGLVTLDGAAAVGARVVVLDATRDPLGSARVLHAVTDREGRYRLSSVAVGEAHVSAISPETPDAVADAQSERLESGRESADVVTVTAFVSATSDVSTAPTIHLASIDDPEPATVLISGVIAMPDGDGVSSCDVRVTPYLAEDPGLPWEVRTLSGHDGAFELTVPQSDEFLVSTRMPGYGTRARVVSLSEAAIGGLQLVIVPTRMVEGRVVASNGRPVPLARVRIIPVHAVSADEARIWLSREWLFTDVDGTFAVPLAYPEARDAHDAEAYVVHVLHDETHLPGTSDVISRSEIESGKPVEVILTSGFRATGTVVDEAGRPVSGASVYIANGPRAGAAAQVGNRHAAGVRERVLVARTRQDGSFVADRLPATPSTLIVEMEHAGAQQYECTPPDDVRLVFCRQ